MEPVNTGDQPGKGFDGDNTIAFRKKEIQEALLEFITRNFMVERSDIKLDLSMIDEGIIDSFGLVEIVTFMESAFDMEVADDDMNRDNFGSVLKIVDYIHRQTDTDIPIRAVT
ncbi:acyl carrier protein [Desulfoluna spongiiphila]|nr:acyl carrier protein [Desulfoluna spongiiphila]